MVKKDSLNSHSYSIITARNPLDKVNSEFEFSIDNHHIKVRAEEGLNEEKRHIEERVVIFVDNNLFKTLITDEGDIKETVVLFNHNVFIHYRVESNWNPVLSYLKDALMFFNSGLYVTVDGKPLEGSIADPAIRIKIASFGYYILAGFLLLFAFTHMNLFIISIIIASIAVVFGLFTKKKPLLFLILGTIWGLLELFGVFISMGSSSFRAPSGAGVLVLVFFILLRVGVVLNFVRGIIAIIQIRAIGTLKEK